MNDNEIQLLHICNPSDNFRKPPAIMLSCLQFSGFTIQINQHHKVLSMALKVAFPASR